MQDDKIEPPALPARLWHYSGFGGINQNSTFFEKYAEDWSLSHLSLVGAAAQLNRLDELKKLIIEQQFEIEQILGKALGFPWYKDDQTNFPEATEADGVCVGEHVPETLADLAASKLSIVNQFANQLAIKIIGSNSKYLNLSEDPDRQVSVVWNGDYDSISNEDLRKLVLNFLVAWQVVKF